MGRGFVVDWANVDWRKQDVVLAAELRCTRERVRQARSDPRFGNGARAERFHKATGVTAAERLEAMNTTDRTLPQLARLAGCTDTTASLLLRRMGKDFRRRPKGSAKYDWTKFPHDWVDRTDEEIAAVVGVPSPAIVAQWRIRHGYRKRSRPIERQPAMTNPYSPSKGYHRIFQRLVADPPATKAELVEFVMVQTGKPQTAAKAAVQVVLSPKAGGRNPRGSYSAMGHLYYVTEDAEGRQHVHPRIQPMERLRRVRRGGVTAAGATS